MRGRVVAGRAGAGRRENASSASKPPMHASTALASPTQEAKTLTQSRLRTAGTTPPVLTSPQVGLSPTRLFSAAGTRPEPAVSVPRANGTRPAATAQAEPELEPPGISPARSGLRGIPYGERTPTRPVANWS